MDVQQVTGLWATLDYTKLSKDEKVHALFGEDMGGGPAGTMPLPEISPKEKDLTHQDALSWGSDDQRLVDREAWFSICSMHLSIESS